MGFFNRKKDVEELDRQYKEALLERDRQQSISVIYSLINDIQALQRFAQNGDFNMVGFMAGKCCNNPLICCGQEELPTVGLKTVQYNILNTIASLEPGYYSDPIRGLSNIALSGRCQHIINACNMAVQQLR